MKQAGGTVIIQNPETARYAGMPRSLAPAVVDIVAELDNIGPAAAKLVDGTYEFASTTEHESSLRNFLEDFRIRRGIDFNGYKLPTIQRRLQRRFVATGVKSLAEYKRYLEVHPEETEELIRAFLIKVTEFFRDEQLFGHLRGHLLPRLVLDSGQRDNQLRVWSAGCATGQEAYSLAILLAEFLGDELDRFNVRVFATDLDGAAVEFARRGVYPSSAVEHLPDSLVAQYFTRMDGEYEVSKPIRSLVIFGKHDLGQRPPFPGIDLVLCRNVLMYFTAELQKRALQLFAFSLRDAGFLVLGKAETVSPLPEYFVPQDQHLRVYRRQGDRTLIPATWSMRPGRQPRLACRDRPSPGRWRRGAAATLVMGRGSHRWRACRWGWSWLTSAMTFKVSTQRHSACSTSTWPARARTCCTCCE